MLHVVLFYWRAAVCHHPIAVSIIAFSLGGIAERWLQKRELRGDRQ